MRMFLVSMCVKKRTANVGIAEAVMAEAMIGVTCEVGGTKSLPADSSQAAQEPFRDSGHRRNRESYCQDAERQAEQDHNEPERLPDDRNSPPNRASGPPPRSGPRRRHRH